MTEAYRKDTVIVIGSGPSGSGMCGTYIDSHPVVRMWDHDWQPSERYGSRYDYGLITTSHDVHHASRRPKKSWLLYNVPHEKTVSAISGDSVVFLDHMKWYEKAAAHGAKPASSRKALKFTRGFAAVAGAIECLRPQRIIVIGMDVLCNGATGSRYFDPAALPFYVKSYPDLARNCPAWAADEMPAGIIGDGPHDFLAEAVIIRELAAEAGTEIVWG